MEQAAAVFWDWNGTLIDDRQFNIDCINRILERYGKDTLTEKTYFETFGFPIVNFYKKLGFEFTRDEYERVADIYMEYYNAGANDVPLRKGAVEALAVYADKGIPQFILTASEKNIVKKATASRNIDKYFTEVLGLDNFLAKGKTDVARRFLEENPINGRIVLIGDTLHDAETAKALGMDCVLLRGGHTSDENLLQAGLPVVDAPNQTYRYILPSGRGNLRTTCDLSFVSRYKSFYDDLKNTNKTEDW